jgi:hypothetical protein
LGGERDADSSAGAEKISEAACGDAQWVQAGEGFGGGAGRVRTVRREVAALRLGWRHGQERHVGYIIRSGIVAVEEIEELDEGNQRPAVVEVEGSADTQVGLNVGSAAEFIESGPDSVDLDAIAVVGQGHGEGPGAFGLG